MNVSLGQVDMLSFSFMDQLFERPCQVRGGQVDVPQGERIPDGVGDGPQFEERYPLLKAGMEKCGAFHVFDQCVRVTDEGCRRRIDAVAFHFPQSVFPVEVRTDEAFAEFRIESFRKE